MVTKNELKGLKEVESVHKVLVALGFERKLAGRLFILRRPEGVVRIEYEDTLSFAKASRAAITEIFQTPHLCAETKKLHIEISQALIRNAAEWADSRPQVSEARAV